MDCREFEWNMSAYISGTLPSAINGKMEAHKAECSECAKLIRIQKLISASLDNVEPVKAPSGLADRILRTVEQQAPENVIELTPGALREVSEKHEEARSSACETFGEHAAAFVDGSLDTSRKAEMERHLESCPLCARVIRMHTVVLSALNSAKPVPTPEGMTARITALAAEQELVHGWKRIGALAAFTAVCGAIAAAFTMVLDHFTGRMLVTLTLFDNIRTSFIESLSLVTALKDTTIAWIARYVPTLPENLALLNEPVTIPYTTYSIPVYFLASLVLLSLTAWKILKTPIDYASVSGIS